MFLLAALPPSFTDPALILWRVERIAHFVSFPFPQFRTNRSRPIVIEFRQRKEIVGRISIFGEEKEWVVGLDATDQTPLGLGSAFCPTVFDQGCSVCGRVMVVRAKKKKREELGGCADDDHSLDIGFWVLTSPRAFACADARRYAGGSLDLAEGF